MSLMGHRNTNKIFTEGRFSVKVKQIAYSVPQFYRISLMVCLFMAPQTQNSRSYKTSLTDARWGGGGEVLPYMGYIGMCRCEGYGFQAVYSRIGYINQSPVPEKLISTYTGLKFCSTLFLHFPINCLEQRFVLSLP